MNRVKKIYEKTIKKKELDAYSEASQHIILYYITLWYNLLYYKAPS